MPPRYRVEMWVNGDQIRPATRGLVMHTLEDVQACIHEQLDHLLETEYRVNNFRVEVSTIGGDA